MVDGKIWFERGRASSSRWSSSSKSISACYAPWDCIWSVLDYAPSWAERAEKKQVRTIGFTCPENLGRWPGITRSQKVPWQNRGAVAYYFPHCSLRYIVQRQSNVGALVAGLDAGLIYNEFPKMGEGLIPPSNELFNPYYTRSENPSTVSIIAHNIGENPVLVQLDHRLLATATFTLVTLAWISAIRRPLPRTIKNGMHSVMGFAVLQVTLGIATLIYMVPTHLAATHQAGSLALLTAILVLLSRLRAPSVTRLLK
jgi:Cytochrome oxidase assembly protein